MGLRNWQSTQLLFVRCCENGTRFEAQGADLRQVNRAVARPAIIAWMVTAAAVAGTAARASSRRPRIPVLSGRRLYPSTALRSSQNALAWPQRCHSPFMLTCFAMLPATPWRPEESIHERFRLWAIALSRTPLSTPRSLTSESETSGASDRKTENRNDLTFQRG